MIVLKIFGICTFVIIFLFAFTSLVITANHIEEGPIAEALNKFGNALSDFFKEPSSNNDVEEVKSIPSEKHEEPIEVTKTTEEVKNEETKEKPTSDITIVEERKEDKNQVEEPKEETGDETVVEEVLLFTGDLNGDDIVDSKDEKIVEGFWGLIGPYQLKSPDLNCDNAVDIDDLFGILNAWGPCELDCSADLNCDLIVDNRDECIIEGYWGLEGDYILSNSPDLNDDGMVNIDDTFFVLAHWT